jgi:hypothetical protein
VGPQVDPARRVRRRPLDAVCALQHLGRELPHRHDRISRLPQLLQHRQGCVAQPFCLLDHPLRRLHGAPAQPSLDEIDRPSLEPGERRTEEAEEVVPRPSCPGETQHRGKRVDERRLREPELAVDGVRDAEGAEHRLERAANPVVAGHHEPDPLRRRPGAGESEHFLGDELERAATPCTLEEADDSVDGWRIAGLVGEECTLEMGQRRRREFGIPGRQLLDRAVSETGEILGRPPKRREGGTARLVGERHRDFGPRGQRLEQRPLRSGEVLEAVGEHRLAVPGVEIRAKPFYGARPQ